MKDRAGRGGSPSIPAGNNGAAGQECCLLEEGSGRRGHASAQSSYASALKPEELRESFWDDGRRGGGSRLRARHPCWLLGDQTQVEGFLCVNLGQQCLCLTCKQE